MVKYPVWLSQAQACPVESIQIAAQQGDTWLIYSPWTLWGLCPTRANQWIAAMDSGNAGSCNVAFALGNIAYIFHAKDSSMTLWWRDISRH
jgi:hypothetical protein